MKRWVAVTIAVFLILAFLAGAGGAYYVLFYKPYKLAENVMPQSGAILLQDAYGALTLIWPEAENADDYLVELKCGDAALWSTECAATSCAVPGKLEADGDVVLTVTSRKGYETPRGEFMRPCGEPLTASYPADVPSLDSLTTALDPDADTLTLTWDPVTGGIYTLFDENGTELKQTGGGEASLTFGADVPMPAKDETARFTLSCGMENYGVKFESALSADVEVVGEDLRDSVLRLSLNDMGYNRYALAWNETRGERYQVQLRRGDEPWNTLRTFTDGEELSMVVGPLEPFEDYDIRVTALGGHDLSDDEFAVEPVETSVSTGASTLYATVWVAKDLDVWRGTDKAEKVGKAVTGKSYCVMGEEDGFFLIYLDGVKGWIDSASCLINLPDYLGDLVSFDITNSYDSIFKVHGYGLPGITGAVVTGYEEVGGAWSEAAVPRTTRPENASPAQPDESEELADPSENPDMYSTEDAEMLEPGEFLAPLLYPTAKKVANAALAAREDGYRLKIYDAFRPYAATRFLYDETESLLQNEIPALPYDGMAGDMWEDYLEYLAALEEREKAPEEREDETEAGEPAEDEPPDGEPAAEPPEDGSVDEPPDGEPAAEPPEDGSVDEPPEEEPAEERRDSYYTVMTDGRYSLNAFLARSGSMHNLGIAVDLTLERIDTGQELEMQTAMHDLSWYSVTFRNNDNADLLAKYMTGAGLGPLSSEWWHFQDDELRKTTSLASRHNGVTRAGWVADSTGWRYRTGDGSFLSGGVFEVDGKSYSFDANGYSDYAAWENE